MAEVIHLKPGEDMPEPKGKEPWLLIEAIDGRFFGSGCARKPKGQEVFYESGDEDEISLDRAIDAAPEWAQSCGVEKIWVQSPAE